MSEQSDKQLEDAENTLRYLGERLWLLGELLATTPHGKVMVNPQLTTDDCGVHMCLWCYSLGGSEGTRPGIVIPALLEIRDYFKAEEPREWFE